MAFDPAPLKLTKSPECPPVSHLVGQPGQVRRTALGRGPFQDKAKPPGPGGQWRLGPAESAPDCLGSGELRPTGITSVFSVEESEELKPRLGSGLVDGVTVNWPAVSAPNYRDRRLRN